MMKEIVKRTILDNQLIQKGEHIVIGLSGGPDSVCLFHILHSLKEEYQIHLHAVHINHGLRPGAADEDQAYVEELCQKYEVPCHVFSFNIKQMAKDQGLSSEDAGRKARYGSFYQVAQSLEAELHCSVKIAVAQNRNDQSETIMMRILRGTGTDGLSGIDYIRQDDERGSIIRPLLDVSRTEIEEYCYAQALSPRIDLTNLEPIYTRNKIRLELLPYLSEQFNPNIGAALNRLSIAAKEDKDYFSQVVDDLMKTHCREKEQYEITIPASILRQLHPAIRHRLMMRILEKIGLDCDISSVHLHQADQVLSSGKTTVVSEFPGFYRMKISYDQAIFSRKQRMVSGKMKKIELSFEYPLNLKGITDIFELNAQIRVTILNRQQWLATGEGEQFKKDGVACCLSLDKIYESMTNPVLRTRKPGDYIIPFGMIGRKKLQDFFVDIKLETEKRNKTLLLCLGSEVIWVVGIRINEKYRIENQTENIICLEYNMNL